MDHLAIMNKSWKLIPKIISGEKSIESRWYQTKRLPWGRIHKGDSVYFKNSGEPVIAGAEVKKVIEFEIKDIEDVKEIIKKYGKQICIVNPNPATWGKLPKYCILIFLQHPYEIKKPFSINKKGFGNATAWITVDSIKNLAL